MTGTTSVCCDLKYPALPTGLAEDSIHLILSEDQPFKQQVKDSTEYQNIVNGCFRSNLEAFRRVAFVLRKHVSGIECTNPHTLVADY